VSYKKLVKIINSCETLEQLNLAERHAMKTLNKLLWSVPFDIFMMPVYELNLNLIRGHIRCIEQHVKAKRGFITNKIEHLTHRVENMNRPQILKILEGAKLIAEALSISEAEVFSALKDQGNITSNEEYILMHYLYDNPSTESKE
jgi:hypothetical protein